jgi:hypothetical protein
MSTVSTAASRSPAGARLGEALTSKPLWLALAITLLLTRLRLGGSVDSDVAWQLWIASRIHSGAHLYRDIIEVNPPLWFWMALPVDSIATFFHLRPESVLTVAIGTGVMLSIAATEALLVGIAAPRRALLLGYAAIALMGVPWVHIGQREQLVLMGTLPYAALIAARRQGQPVSRFIAILVGVGAALGFALKHYFLLVPASLELWLLAGTGRKWRLRRPELVALAAVGALYAAAILLWGSDFLTKTVPLVRLAYGMLRTPSLAELVAPFAAVGLTSLGVSAFCVMRPPRKAMPVTSALLVAASAFAIVYFIQAKGWIYHALPLVGCASLALAAMLVESAQPMRFLRLFAPALLAFPLFLAADEQLHPALPSSDLQDALVGLRPGDTVGFLAAETALPWSVTLQHRLRYPSRYMGYWMLNAIVTNERLGSPDPRLVSLGRRITAETVQDFACAPPRRIIVARPRPGEDAFDILPFFLRDANFAALLSHYEKHSRTSVETYELASPLPPPQGPCRAGV